MPSRYNQLLPNQQYVSTYVPLPFDTLLQAGAMKQKAQDEAIAEKEKYLAKTWNRLAPDAENARKLKQSWDQKLEALSNRDFTDPQVKSEWYKAKREMLNDLGPDGAIGAQEASYNAFQAKKKDLDAMLAKGSKDGGIDEPQYNYILKKALDEYRAKGGIGEKGPEGYNTIGFETPAAYQDFNTQALAIGNGFKADAIKRGYWTDTNGKQWAVKNSSDWEAVDRNEVKKAVRLGLMSDPMNQAYAKRLVDIKTYGKDVPTELKGQLLDNLFEAPAEMVAIKEGYKKTGQDQDIRENSVFTHAANKKTDEQVLTTSSQSEALPGSLTDVNADVKDLEFNKDGSLKPITTNERQVIGQAGQNLSFANTPSGANAIYKAKQFDMEANKKAVAFIKSLQQDNPELQGLNPQQTIEAYKKANKALQTESVPLITISGPAAENIGNAIARNKTQRNFYIFDGKGTTSDGQLSTVLDKLGINEEDFDKALKSGIGGYTQAGPSAGAYYVEVPDNNGNSRRVTISPDNEMGTIFRASQMLNEARKTFKKSVVTPYQSDPSFKISVTPNISKDGEPSWTYTKLRVDNNGNIIESEDASLDKIRQEERDILDGSGFLGSNTTVLKPHTTQ